MKGKTMKRILVDMSATLLHHGHIRLLERAANHGLVIVGLTTDEEIHSRKGYIPELNFEERAEILRSIKYVSEVIPSDWLVTEEFLDLNRIDYIVHGDDHQNPISENRVILFPRTKGISSIELRERVLQNIQAKSL